MIKILTPITSHPFPSIYNLIRSFLFATLLIALILLLNACSAPTKASSKLTNGHMDKLRLAFVGREFVFRTDWHSKMVIYKGKPAHWYDTYSNKTPLVKAELQKLGTFQAYGGDVATFTNVRPWTHRALALYFIKKNGSRGIIRISTANKEIIASEFWEELTDQSAKISWINNQLTQGTIKFLSVSAKSTNKIPAVLPKPPEQPTLTPAPTRAIPMETKKPSSPSISRLNVRTDPTSVRRGEMLKLVLDYTINTPDLKMIEITEHRNILFNGKSLPNYPKVKTELRSDGRHTTVFRQKIPSHAKQGIYTYRGEVCMASGCSSQLKKFSIGD